MLPNNAPQCDCKQSIHSHGTYIMYTIHKCRCSECRQANRDYDNRRIRMNLYGRSQFTNTVRVREHVNFLLNNGFGIKQIHKISGVPQSSISRILYGRTERGEGPAKRILKANEAKILAVHPKLENLAAAKVIDGTGTVRRLRALVAVGWSVSKLADRMGWDDASMNRLIVGGERVFVSTALRVRELYEEIWDQVPEASTHYQRGSITKAKNRAAANGWAPPMAWDDDRIDDPKYNFPKSALREQEINC